MTATVHLTSTNKALPQVVDQVGSVEELLRRLSVSPQEYLVAIDDALVSVDTPLADGDNVTLIRVVTGG